MSDFLTCNSPHKKREENPYCLLFPLLSPRKKKLPVAPLLFFGESSINVRKCPVFLPAIFPFYCVKKFLFLLCLVPIFPKIPHVFFSSTATPSPYWLSAFPNLLSWIFLPSILSEYLPFSLPLFGNSPPLEFFIFADLSPSPYRLAILAFLPHPFPCSDYLYSELTPTSDKTFQSRYSFYSLHLSKNLFPFFCLATLAIPLPR